MAEPKEIENFVAHAIKARILDGSGNLSEVAVRDGVLQVTFSGVSDDTHVLETLSGAMLDLRLQLEVVPELDVHIRRG
ncbi:hypothetical protein [Methylocapsa acidiphila]|uniref:hypothetical protein n=1 Tax=Methylocapsa acidiphila TaxID=133552 RepID=UPI0003FCAE19|nr:hypothetical protein [Methylocapsa acidiphila]